MSQPERKIYLASSWRNTMQQAVVITLRKAGFEVYDFRDADGFHWSEIDPGWLTWTPETYSQMMNHPKADLGFNRDVEAMIWADTCVLVLPCGRSAHLELGWMTGQEGKETAILLNQDGFEPELMYKMVDYVAPNLIDLLGWLGVED